jgi:hypothetical protein
MNKDRIQKIYNSNWGFEIRRLWVVILFTVLMLAWDANRSVVLFALAITTGTIAVSHITRKLLFPYVDLGALLRKSSEHPLGASVIFASIIYLITILIQSTVLLLK